MKIIFWGTRGSLPAPLGAKGVRKKLVNALVKSAGKNLDTPEKAEAFCDCELSFSERGTFGGNTSCVQVDTGGPEYLLCDLGSGVREFSLVGHHQAWAQAAANLSCADLPCALGSHHGLSLLRALLHPGQPHHSLQLP